MRLNAPLVLFGLLGLFGFVPFAGAATLSLDANGQFEDLEDIVLSRVDLEVDRTVSQVPLTLGTPRYSATLVRLTDTQSLTLQRALLNGVLYQTMTITIDDGGPGTQTSLTLTNVKFTSIKRSDNDNGSAEKLELTMDAYTWTTL